STGAAEPEPDCCAIHSPGRSKEGFGGGGGAGVGRGAATVATWSCGAGDTGAPCISGAVVVDGTGAPRIRVADEGAAGTAAGAGGGEGAAACAGGAAGAVGAAGT